MRDIKDVDLSLEGMLESITVKESSRNGSLRNKPVINIDDANVPMDENND